MGFNSAPGSGLGNGPVKTQEKVLTPEDRSAKREDIDRRIEAKKEELKKFLMKITEKRQRKLFYLFRTAIVQQKKRRNHKKDILKVFQTIKMKKIMTFWKNKTKKNELVRNEKKLSSVSYKILMFSAFFKTMKPILIIRKKLKRIKKQQAEAIKLKFFTRYKQAFKISKFPRFFKKIDNKI